MTRDHRTTVPCGDTTATSCSAGGEIQEPLQRCGAFLQQRNVCVVAAIHRRLAGRSVRSAPIQQQREATTTRLRTHLPARDPNAQRHTSSSSRHPCDLSAPNRHAIRWARHNIQHRSGEHSCPQCTSHNEEVHHPIIIQCDSVYSQLSD